MKPYFEDEAVVIYHADSRQMGACGELPEASAVITDPPYGTGLYWTDHQGIGRMDLLDWFSAAPTVAVFGWPERLVNLCVDAKLVPDEWVTWWPTNGAQRGMNMGGPWREVECIAVFGRHHLKELRQTKKPFPDVNYDGPTTRMGKREKGERRLSDVWTDASPGQGFDSHLRQHPNEKPLTLMRRLIEGLTREGMTVLDPFMGSGTTLRAAKDLGRKAIGIEIEERYCETAAKRMAQAVLL